ncbi:MAG: elongation factor G [Desulfobacterales bacterium]|nr:elongation factor G [Desulfobacterales bacterium]
MTEHVEKIRNIAIVGHGGSGKTSLAEILLFRGGATQRLGSVEAGNTAMDYEPEELKRGSSISSAFHQYSWKKHTVNLIDTPGDQNFFTDTRNCMTAAEGAVLVLDAVDGVKVQSEQAWDLAAEFNMPCIIFVNRLDRERSDFSRTVEAASGCFEPKPTVLQLPIGSEAGFKGLVDLVGMRAYIYDAEGQATAGDIPPEMQAAAEIQREALLERVAEVDDELLERYLEGDTLADEEIKSTLRKGVLARAIVPVVCGSAIKNIGIDLLMDFLIDCMPSPLDRSPKTGADPNSKDEIERPPDPAAPFSAIVFKTIADPYAGRLSILKVFSGSISQGDGKFFNSTRDTRERFSQLLRLLGKEQQPVGSAGPGDIVAIAKLKETVTWDTLCDEGNKILFASPQALPTMISFAVKAKSKGDEDKIFSSLSRLMEEDPGLQITRNSETKEILLSGMGQIHIETTVEKLKRKFNVEAELNIPKIPYKETIKKKIRVQGRHKKQTGGHGQFGDCWIQLEPLPRGGGFEFVDAIVGGSIPRQYIPAVEKGIIESSQRGILAGFPCVDFRAILDDGSFHTVDSSEMAFKIAGSLAFRKAASEANAVLLEPVMKITINTPDEYMGDIMGDLNGRRGRVLGMDSKGKNQLIIANVPMSEFLTYAPDLNSMTGGRGTFTLEFSHYDEVPAQMSQKIVEEANQAKE